MIHTIQNQFLTAQISSYGAELQSLKAADGREYLHDGKRVWQGRAPILFPIVGRLKNETFTYEGKTYTQPGHGFARTSEFTAVQTDAARVVFELRDSPETLRNYPFRFVLQVIFALEDDLLAVTYQVINPEDKPLYFSIGAHEAYRCPNRDDERFEDYELLFEKRETVDTQEVTGPLRSGTASRFLSNSDRADLTYDFFRVDALVLFGLQSHSVKLQSKKHGTGVEVCFPGFPMLGIWTRPGAPYLCIEPWCGVCDSVDSDGELTRKYGINRLEGKETFSCRHTIRPY